jgi:hypothetical protein
LQISLDSQREKHCKNWLDPDLQRRDGQFFEALLKWQAVQWKFIYKQGVQNKQSFSNKFYACL